MVPLGMVLGFAGYGISTWGYVLIKGYNISLRQWFSPLHPYTGALDAAGMVPQGQIFPGGKAAAASSGHPLDPQQQAGRQALQHGRNPHGFVQ